LEKSTRDLEAGVLGLLVESAEEQGNRTVLVSLSPTFGGEVDSVGEMHDAPQRMMGNLRSPVANIHDRRSMYKRCIYKKGIASYFPMDAFNNTQNVELAKTLYVQLYENFARLVLLHLDVPMLC
jgi:hypothetical protein